MLVARRVPGYIVAGAAPLLAAQPGWMRCYAASASTSAAAAAAGASGVSGAVAQRPQFGTEPLVLFQYDTCPFCNKVKASLDYHKVAYVMVEVNPLTKGELKGVMPEGAKISVPILVIDRKPMRESNDIIERVKTQLNGGKAPEATPAEAEWVPWIDNNMMRTLAPNIYRTWDEAVESCDYIATRGEYFASSSEVFMAKYASAIIMYIIAKRLKKKHGIEDERKAIISCVDTWIKAVGDKPFLGGSTPNQADLNMFGVLRAIRTLRTYEDIAAATNVQAWFDRMDKVVGSSAGSRARVADVKALLP